MSQYDALHNREVEGLRRQLAAARAEVERLRTCRDEGPREGCRRMNLDRLFSHHFWFHSAVAIAFTAFAMTCPPDHSDAKWFTLGVGLTYACEVPKMVLTRRALVLVNAQPGGPDGEK